MSKPVFCIVDMMPFLYKGHFAFLKKPRVTSSGVNVSALSVYAGELASVLSRHSPDYVAVAADSRTATFRHEAYPEYKAGRAKMPEDIAAAVPQAFEFAAALGIPVVR